MRWLVASRYCFNQAIAEMRKHGFISKYDLRKVILNVGVNDRSSLPDWIKKSPYHLKVNAINEAHAAFKASRQRGTKQQEAGKFRSIRDRVQSIKFRVEDFKKGTRKALNSDARGPALSRKSGVGRMSIRLY